MEHENSIKKAESIKSDHNSGTKGKKTKKTDEVQEKLVSTKRNDLESDTNNSQKSNSKRNGSQSKKDRSASKASKDNLASKTKITKITEEGTHFLSQTQTRRASRVRRERLRRDPNQRRLKGRAKTRA